jgi:hypothetical protein
VHPETDSHLAAHFDCVLPCPTSVSAGVVWLAPQGESSDRDYLLPRHHGASTDRKTMDGDKEFEMLKTKLLQVGT